MSQQPPPLPFPRHPVRPDARPQQKQIKVQELVAVKELAELERDVVVMRSAYDMARKGQTRATATELAQHDKDYFYPAWEVGQLCHRYGMQSVASHGRNRFVLDVHHLKAVADAMEKRIGVLRPAVEEDLARFDNLAESVKGLMDRVESIERLQKRRQTLADYVNANNDLEYRISRLEANARSVQERVQRAEALENYITQAEEKAKAIPRLEKRKAALDERLTGLEQKQKQTDALEKDAARREAEHARRLEQLHKREKWTTIAELDEAITTATSEFEVLQKQLGEKRGLLSRITGGGKPS